MSRTSPSATADASAEAVPRRAKHDIHYTETNFLGAYRVIVRYLNAVGRVTTTRSAVLSPPSSAPDLNRLSRTHASCPTSSADRD